MSVDSHELDKQIDSIIERAETDAINDKGMFAGMDNNLMNRQSLSLNIRALIESAIQEARKDELKRLPKQSPRSIVRDFYGYTEEERRQRIAELEQPNPERKTS